MDERWMESIGLRAQVHDQYRQVSASGSVVIFIRAPGSPGAPSLSLTIKGILLE